MATPLRKRNRSVQVFGVEFEHVSFVLGALGLPMQSLAQIEYRYGSIESYIRRKFPETSEQEILKKLLSTPSNFIRDPVNRRVVEILQEAIRNYLSAHPDMPQDKVFERLVKLGFSNNFTQDLRESLRRY